MPSDLLTLRLPSSPAAPRHALRSVRSSDRDALARRYLESYPPEVGAVDLAAARAGLDATFAGEYGVLRVDASLLAEADGVAAGCILVMERSIWDPQLEGPFVIDLFVAPSARGRGIGRALVTGAVLACAAGGATTLSLRVGAGTSAAAHALYRDLGFEPV